MTTIAPAPATIDVDATVLDAVVVGAGFAGLYALHRLLSSDRTAIAVETGHDVGGTWYWNRYPGARCDVRSAEYSYSFDTDLEQSWHWSERFAAQPEIHAYARHVADRFDLRQHIRFGTTVIAARWDDESRTWSLTTQAGDTLTARTCIWATGPLSVPKTPDIAGLESFEGELLVTGAWPDDAPDLTGQRVGVIGTGSSGIQVVTSIADSVGELLVFQRTPSFSLPARNVPVDADTERELKSTYAEIRATARSMPNGQATRRIETPLMSLEADEREQLLWELWEFGGIGLNAAFPDVLTDRRANDMIANFVRDRILELVDDAATAKALLPGDHPIGSRRVCIDVGYYSRFNLPHVHLVNLLEHPIEQITPTGVRTTGGDYDVDVLVLATGFDAMTGALTRIDIQGTDGRSLADTWATEGPATYLGMMMDGFPNMFTVNGPGSPSVMMNVILALEHHVDVIMDLLDRRDALGQDATISTDATAQEQWTRYVAETAANTIFDDANSWYTGANIPGKPRTFLPYVGGFPRYVDEVDDALADDLRGFHLHA